MKKSVNHFRFYGDCSPLMIVVFSLCFVGGLVMLFLPKMVSIGGDGTSWLVFCGMCLFAYSFSYFVYFTYGEDADTSVFWKIIIPLAVGGVYAGLFFLYRLILFNVYSGEIDAEDAVTVIAIIASSGILVLGYIALGLTGAPKWLYIVALPVCIIIAIIITAIIVLWYTIVGIIVGVIFVYIVFRIICAFQDASNGNYGDKYKTEDGTELEYKGGGKYEDEYGNTWTSDDGGETVYKD